MKKLLSIALAGLVGLMVWTGATSAESAYPKQKVVYHINGDDPKQHEGALRNIQNHINAVGADNIEVRVVMHGNGLSMVILPDALAELPKFKSASANESMQVRIDGLKNQGVAFKICNNTVQGRQVKIYDHLYNVDEEDIIPSGVAELAHLQAQGFTYIKP